MSYIATMNTPGYLPWSDDEPPVFETAAEAWDYLAEERARQEDDFADDDESSYSDTVHELRRHADARWLVSDFERAGTVYGPTPGYDGSHDLGIAYCVTYVDDDSNGEWAR